MLPFITQPPVAAYSIENALLFRGGQYLKRTPGAGDQMKWTFSCWVKGSFPANGKGYIFGQNDGSSPDYNRCEIQLTSGGIFLTQNPAGSTIEINVGTNVALRDPTAWYHVVVVWDSAQPNASDRVRIFVNGAEVSYSSTAYPMQHKLSWVNASGKVHYIGCETPTWNLTTGYLAEAAFIDGQALPPTTFGEVDAVTGSWRPKKLTGIEWGTNGFHLGAPWSFTDLGKDYSDRNNTWAPVGFLASDVVKDSPTNVYATLNPLSKGSLVTLAEGGLAYTTTVSAGLGSKMQVYATLPIPATGVWQMEMTIKSAVFDSSGGCGVALQSGPDILASTFAFYMPDYGQIRINGSIAATVQTATLNDVISVVANANAGTVSWYKNGLLLYRYAAGQVLAGMHFFLSPPSSTTASAVGVNFGQRSFAFLPEAAARALCTANMPATTGVLEGTFTGNANADGPCIYTGAVPLTLTINGTHEVTWGVHADKLATGFKLRTADTGYNASGSNSWKATYDRKPTVGRNHVPANAQANP